MILCDSLGSSHPQQQQANGMARQEVLNKVVSCAFCSLRLTLSLSQLNYFIGVLNFWTLIEFDCSFSRNRFSLSRLETNSKLRCFIGFLAKICEKCFRDCFSNMCFHNIEPSIERLLARFMRNV